MFKKLFFTEANAEGAHFGVTLLLQLPWLWLAFAALAYGLLGLGGWPKAAVVVIAVFTLLAMVTILYGFVLVAGGLFANRRNLSGQAWGKVALSAGLLFCGAWLLGFLYWRGMRTFLGGGILGNSPGGMPKAWKLPGFIEGMMGSPWCIVFVALAVILLGAGYLLAGKVFAESEGMDDSQLWTRRVRCSWLALLVIYVCFFAFGLLEGASLHVARKGLERKIGRPLTVQGLADCYYHGEEPSAEFWEQVAEKSKARDKVMAAFEQRTKKALPYRSVIGGYPQGEMPTEVILQFRRVGMDNPETRAYETLFDHQPPPHPRDYVAGNPLAILLPELARMREFCRMELWRVRLAVGSRDFAAAKAAIDRLKNVSGLLEHDHFLISGLVWGACETYRCQAIAMVIGAGLGDESWLAEVDGEMAAQEEIVEPLRLQAMIWGEAVVMTDALTGGWAGGLVPGSAAMSSLKWLTPQLWWCYMRDKKNYMKFLARGVDGPLPLYEPRSWGLLSAAGALAGSERMWTGYRANFRMIRALVAVAREKRRSGSWPQQTPTANWPEDPFAPGEPLKYQCGSLEVNRPVWKPKERQFENRTATVSAVRVYSVGQNGRDDGGRTRSQAPGADDQSFWFAITAVR